MDESVSPLGKIRSNTFFSNGPSGGIEAVEQRDKAVFSKPYPATKCSRWETVVQPQRLALAVKGWVLWLTVEQFGRLEPHLPRDTRGKSRVDDRRVVSGIVHVLKSGGRRADVRRSMDPARRSTTASPTGQPRAVREDFFQPWPQRVGHRGPGDDRRHGGGRPSFGKRWRRGECDQAIGRSLGGRTTKIHALSDPRGQPLAFPLTGGQVAGCTAADRLLDTRRQGIG